MRALALAALLAPAVLAQPAVVELDPASPAGEAFAAGWARYADLGVGEAVPLWREAAAQAETPEAARAVRAWLAEALRRQGQTQEDAEVLAEAVALARAVIAEDACQAHAHLVLADALNGQFFEWPGASADSSRAHLARALACDPGDGNAWMSAWVDAVRRGDDEAEGRALRQLHRVGFWPAPVLAFARWTLATAPADAVLLTNGDADTVPMRIAQQVEGLRPDVAVVNVSMLELTEVARHIAEKHELPLPDSVETFETRYDARGSGETAEGRVYSLRDAILDGWLVASANHQVGEANGALGRPLVAALTIDPAVLGTKTDLVDRGSHLAPADAAGFDAAAARAAFAGLDGTAFTGPLVSDGDRSPVRRAFAFDPGGLVLFQKLQTAVALAQESDADGAEAVYLQARRFAGEAGRADDPLIGIAREWIDAALESP